MERRLFGLFFTVLWFILGLVYAQEDIERTLPRRARHGSTTGERRPKIDLEGMKRSNMQNRERMEKWRVHIGKDAEQVAELIKNENPDIKTVQIVPEGAMVTMDHRMDRVRIYNDANGKVASKPRVG